MKTIVQFRLRQEGGDLRWKNPKVYEPHETPEFPDIGEPVSLPESLGGGECRVRRKDFMRLYWNGCGRSIVVAIVLVFLGQHVVAQQKPATFELTVSLPVPTMHVGDDLLVKVTTSNSTDHVVHAGNGYGVGVAVELLNKNGEDIGIHAMGGKREAPTTFTNSSTLSLRPGTDRVLTFRFKPEQEHLVLGVYKLRVHCRDMDARTNVFSNTVMLTVVP